MVRSTVRAKRSPEEIQAQQAVARAKRADLKERRAAKVRYVPTWCDEKVKEVREHVAEQFGMRVVLDKKRSGDFGDDSGCHLVCKSGRAATSNSHGDFGLAA